MTTPKITIKATVLAPVSIAWNNYTQPEHITQWNFASDDWCCPTAENDMRPGGKYNARMEARDGSFGFDFEATYTEVVEGKKFTYVMPDKREVNVFFEPNDSFTSVTVIFDAENQNPVEMQREGWQSILNNYKKYTEAQLNK